MTKATREIPNINVAIKGDPKTGKTHLALTFPGPIALFSFDIGVNRVLPKFKAKEIETFFYELPLLETAGKNVKFAEEIWKRFMEEYHYVTEAKTFKTVVVDTGSGLYDICRFAYREHTGQGNIIKVQYEEVYARMSGVLMAPHYGGFNLVSTYHLKEEYRGGEPTGAQILDGYKRTEGLVDLVLQTHIEPRKLKDKTQNVIVTTITDCGFDFTLNGLQLDNTDYDELVGLVFPEE